MATRTVSKLFIITTFALFIAALAPSAHGDVVSEFRFNNENWFTTPHPEVASFTSLPDRSAHGTTTTGIPFRLFNIPTTDGVMLQRFEIQDHFHYIVDGRVVYTLPEVSAALAAE